MDIRELGNELLRRQTLYEQSLKQSEEAVGKIKAALGSLTEEQIEACRNVGVDVTPLKRVDLERMKSDREYRDEVCKMQDEICDKLTKVLEHALCLE